jgi:hypothetical protein
MTLIDKQNEIIHKIINELYAIEKRERAFNVEAIVESRFPSDLAFVGGSNRITEIMVEKDLIVSDKDSGIDKLRPFGRQIAESPDGWLGHLKKENEQAEKPEKDKKSERNEKRIWQGISALFGSVAVVLGVLQYNKQDRTRALEGLRSKQAGQITKLKLDSADQNRLLETRDKEIREIRQSLKSSRDSLKVKK